MELSPNSITLPMDLGAKIEVVYEKVVFVGPLAEIVTGTLTELTDDMLPPDLTTIRDYLFQNNELLTTVELNNITEIGISAFKNCAIESVNMPELTEAGMQAFSINPFTSIELPELVSIGTQMFQGCENLEFADFPKAESIYRGAFNGCANLGTLILRNNQVASLVGTQQLYGTKIESGSGYIYVPDELVDDYKATSGWSIYANQIRSIDELEVE